jgi:nitrogen PTS system EIIA component
MSIEEAVKIKNIYDYLDPNLTCFLECDTRDEALKKLVSLLEEEGKLHDSKAFYQAILQREEMISTGIGMGIAVPHAKLEGYDSFFVAIGIHPIGIPWGSLDGVPVRLVFMIGGPERQQTEYLRLLSGLTMALKDENRRKKMLQLKETQEIIGLFKGT